MAYLLQGASDLVLVSDSVCRPHIACTFVEVTCHALIDVTDTECVAPCTIHNLSAYRSGRHVVYSVARVGKQQQKTASSSAVFLLPPPPPSNLPTTHVVPDAAVAAATAAVLLTKAALVPALAHLPIVTQSKRKKGDTRPSSPRTTAAASFFFLGGGGGGPQGEQQQIASQFGPRGEGASAKNAVKELLLSDNSIYSG